MSNSINARYNMTAELWTQTTSQNRAGEIERAWTFKREFPCIARGVTGGGIRVVGSTERWVEGDYSDIEWVKLQTSTSIDKRDRVYNIKTRGEDVSSWSTYDPETETFKPKMFEVLGATPIQDPFGRQVEFDVLLTGAENQEGWS